MMISDTSFVTPNSMDLTEGELSIFDCEGFSARHFWKIVTNYSTLKLFLRYVQEAAPFRISQNHYVNCSPMMMKLIALVRPFLRKELFDVMHFHSSGYASLYKHIPRYMLPDEYGGMAGKLDEIYKKSLELVERQSDYLKDDKNWQLLE